MKNILKLFRRDCENVLHSVIGMVVVVGLVVVPALYAWFNIAGSWDPYGNTGNLKVAVANADKGYKSDLIPVEVNIGDSVVNSLRANDSFDWTFVDKDEAVDGVKSGKYYAAVVIPSDFSANMMTLFSTEVKHSDIEYYENQKVNAIAQIVTEKGSSAVQSQINKTFTETVGNIGLATASSLLEFMDSDQVANFVAHLSSSLGDGANELTRAGQSVSSLSDVLASSSGLLANAGSSLSQNSSTSDAASQLLTNAQNGLDDIKSALSGASSSINQALRDSAGSFDAVSSAVDQAFTDAGSHVDPTVGQLNDIADNLSSHAEEIRGIQQEILDLKTKFPQVSAQLDQVAASVGKLADSYDTLSSGISDAASKLSSGAADVAATKKEVTDLIAQVKSGIGGVKDDYEGNLKDQASQLQSTISGIAASSADISKNLDDTVASLSDASASLSGNLNDLNGVLSDTSTALTDAGKDLSTIKEKLDTAVANNDLESIRSIIGEDPEGLADALAAPVGIDRKAIYPIKNYGSSMAPFYTILSLWVGSIVLAAMMKVSVDDKLLNELKPFRLHEIYLGRYMLFGMLALCQATLVCLGDILFFRIQCIHPFQFILAAWIASLVFSNIIYTFTVSFGDIGKALAVVLLVMQVGGSGGTFPIEMTAPFFQSVYPFLPFTHGIAAMHAAIAGSYGAEVWIEMGILTLYLLPSLALGLLFRRPVIRANNWIIEKLEETKLM